jgi:type IV pilus biogenesis protein CpaD/CtpE
VKVAPARSVLAKGQRYLTQEEWNREIGSKISDEISFKLQTGILDASQKEYLFYIANKLQLQKDILFHLVVKEEENPKFSTSRLTAITDHLVQSGIERERIITEQVERVSKADRGKVEIRLIKR